MQTLHPNPQPSSSKSSSTKTIPQPHKTHLNIHYLSFPSDMPLHPYQRRKHTSAVLPKLQVHQKLQTPSAVKSLTLDLQNIVFPQATAPKIIIHFLKEFRNLESLKIDRIPFKDTPILAKALTGLRTLKSLQVTFTSPAAQNYRGDYIRDLVKSLYKSCPRMKQLKFAFDDNPSAYADDFRSELKNWKINRLNTLQKLVIHFPIPTFLQSKKDKKGVLSLQKHINLSPMKRFHKLKSLDIALLHRRRDNSTHINTNDLHFDPNKLFPDLKKFTWSVIGSWPFQVKELNPLGSQIASRLRRLEDFRLGFRQKEARVGVEIRDLSQCLAMLQRNLSRLSLVHGCGEISGEDLKVLISEFSLQRVKKLETLSLEFHSCKGLNNNFLEDLAQGIAKNLVRIRSLRISFESREEDQKSFFDKMKSIISSEGISDRGVKKFASILSKGCFYLEFLSLEFKKYSEVSDKGVKSLCKRLGRLRNLKQVWLRFQGCNDVTEIGCQEAVNKLRENQRKVFFYCI